jgi:hypothetical protein
MAKPRTRLGILGSALGWTGLALLLANVGLWYQYAGTRPRSEQPEEGRIYALNTHGSVAYLTLGENLRLWSLGLGGAGCMVTAMIIGRRTKEWLL